MPDMRLTEEEKKDFSTPQAPKAPQYPYGLRITLQKEQLERLGLSKPEMDKELKFEASAKVVSISAENEVGDENDLRVELQITEMYLKKEEKDQSIESVIYRV